MDEEEDDEGHRVVKVSFGKLISPDVNHHNDQAKDRYIDVCQELVITASQIASYVSIVARYALMCVYNQNPDPDDILPILDQKFLYQIFNPSLRQGIGNITNPYAQQVINSLNDQQVTFPDLRVLGQGWILGYIVKMYIANIKTSVLGKWKAFIVDTINSLLSSELNDLSRRAKQRHKKEIIRLICTPTARPPNPPVQLFPLEQELVAFHRAGLLAPNDNQWITKDYIRNGYNGGNQITRYQRFIKHFYQCNQYSARLRDDFPDALIKMRPCLPLHKIGNRISIFFDKVSCSCS